MKQNLFIAAILSLIFGVTASAQTTAFVFQGKLQDGASAANGTYQFQFRMFDAASGGNQIGQTLTDIPATVSNGIFAATLDFGANSFDGAARFIEISVRSNNGGQAYTLLNPRQAVTSTPYAVKSLNSEQANTANNSLNLGSIPAANYTQTNDPRLSDDRSPLPDSPNYIQNTTNAQASSNFNISGIGKANVLSANSQFNLSGFRMMHISGNFNTFVGFETGNALTSGTFNAIFGTSSGRSNTSGTNNSFFGALAGRDNSTGNENSFFGQAAGLLNTTGAGNSFFGYGAGVDNTTGAKNTFVGFLTGQTNANGSENTFIGYKANGAAGITNATAVGANAFVTQSNTIVLGTNLVTVQVPGNLTVANTFSANALDSATVYKIGGNRVFHLTGTDNTFVGLQSGNSITSGGFNAFFGSNAGKGTTTGLNNAFFGAYAGRDNTTGGNNAFFGANAGISNNSSFNAFFGSNSGFSNTNGANNSYFGSGTGLNNSTGDNNSFFGSSAGKSVNNSSFNSFIGSFSGEKTTTGAGNTFLGAFAGRENTIGFNNTFIGYKAGQTPTTGNSNVVIGYNASFTSGVSNSVAIGANASVTASNQIVLGNDQTQTVRTFGNLNVFGDISANSSSFYRLSTTDEVNLSETLKITLATAPFEPNTVSVDGLLKASKASFSTGLEAQVVKIRYLPQGGTQNVCFTDETIDGLVYHILSRCSSDFSETEGVKSAQTTTALVDSVKEQQTRIETLAADNQKLQEQLKQQQAQIDALKALICQSNPTAAVCASPKDK